MAPTYLLWVFWVKLKHCFASSGLEKENKHMAVKSIPTKLITLMSIHALTTEVQWWPNLECRSRSTLDCTEEVVLGTRARLHALSRETGKSQMFELHLSQDFSSLLKKGVWPGTSAHCTLYSTTSSMVKICWNAWGCTARIDYCRILFCSMVYSPQTCVPSLFAFPLIIVGSWVRHKSSYTKTPNKLWKRTHSFNDCRKKKHFCSNKDDATVSGVWCVLWCSWLTKLRLLQ